MGGCNQKFSTLLQDVSNEQTCMLQSCAIAYSTSYSNVVNFGHRVAVLNEGEGARKVC